MVQARTDPNKCQNNIENNSESHVQKHDKGTAVILMKFIKIYFETFTHNRVAVV